MADDRGGRLGNRAGNSQPPSNENAAGRRQRNRRWPAHGAHGHRKLSSSLCGETKMCLHTNRFTLTIAGASILMKAGVILAQGGGMGRGSSPMADGPPIPRADSSFVARV